jgi:hypothetical protein
MGKAFAAASVLVSVATIDNAHAEFIVNIDQVGSNVVVTGSGTLDINGLAYNETITTAFSSVDAQFGQLSIGPTGDSSSVYVYLGITGPSNFGTGGLYTPSSGSGDYVGMQESSESLAVPAGYISGSSLFDTMTFDDTTLAALGLTPGTYTYFLNGEDTFQINIGTTPLPATLPLFAGGLSFVGFLAKRRKQNAKPAIAAA